jgi:hypothetical protein
VRARWDDWGGLARTPSAAPGPTQPVGGSSLGEIAFLPLSVTRMRLWQPVVAGHIAALSESSNVEAVVTNLPLRQP